MTSTACDDQWAMDRDAAIDEMARVVSPDEWRGGGHMRYAGHTITWGEYVTRRHELEDEEAFTVGPWIEGEERIDRIAQSDASGDHYAQDAQAPCGSDFSACILNPCGMCPGYEYAEDSDGESALSQALSMPSKYHVRLKGAWCDVYDVLQAFGVTNPADAHAIKKMLMPGKRGHKGGVQDRQEAIQSLRRAIELEEEK